MPVVWPFTSITAPNFKASIQAVPTGSLGSITASLIRVLGMWITNNAATELWVTVTDDPGAVVLNQYPIPANDMKELEALRCMEVTGLKWQAEAAGLQGQVEGWT